jgi:hypothetical protein
VESGIVKVDRLEGLFKEDEELTAILVASAKTLNQRKESK